MLSLLSHVKSCMFSYFIIAKLIIYYRIEHEDWGSVYDSSLTKFSGVTLTQSYICLQLEGSEKHIQTYQVSKSAVLEYTALFSLRHWHLPYCHAFTLFANSFLVLWTSFVLLKSCSWCFGKCQRWFCTALGCRENHGIWTCGKSFLAGRSPWKTKQKVPYFPVEYRIFPWKQHSYPVNLLLNLISL